MSKALSASLALSWSVPPCRLITLPPSTIHLWKVNLLHAAKKSFLESSLPPFELESSKSMTSKQARAVLRNILSRYLDKSPSGIFIKRESNGKPYIPSGPMFNLTHTDDTALIAIATKDIGVDIERADRQINTNLSRLVKRFTISEASAIRFAHDPNKAFLKTWIRKEAFLKCTGYGIKRGLDSFEVTIDRDNDWLVHIDNDYHNVNRYWTASKFIGSHKSIEDQDDNEEDHNGGYYAAIACMDQCERQDMFRWEAE